MTIKRGLLLDVTNTEEFLYSLRDLLADQVKHGPKDISSYSSPFSDYLAGQFTASQEILAQIDYFLGQSQLKKVENLVLSSEEDLL